MSAQRRFERQLNVALNTALWGSLDWAVIRGVTRYLSGAIGDKDTEIVVADNDGTFRCDSVDAAEDELRTRGTSPERIEVMLGDPESFGAYMLLWTTDNPPRDDLPKPAWVAMTFAIVGTDETRVLGTAQAIETSLGRGVLREERREEHREEQMPKVGDESPAPAPRARHWYQWFWPENAIAWIVVGLVGSLLAAGVIAIIARVL